jgi:hypothetical protein
MEGVGEFMFVLNGLVVCCGRKNRQTAAPVNAATGITIPSRARFWP